MHNFHRNTLKALAEMIAAAGLEHPSQLRPEHILRRVSGDRIQPFSAIFPLLQPGELLDGEAEPAVYKFYWPKAQARIRSSPSDQAQGGQHRQGRC